MRCAGGRFPRCPVKTDGAVPKGKIFELMRALDDVELTAPVRLGQTVLENVCGTGVNIVATRGLDAL